MYNDKLSIAEINNSGQIALLHYQTLKQGLLPKLGISFLKSLYRFLIPNELVLVHRENNHVPRFVSSSLSSQGIMNYLSDFNFLNKNSVQKKVKQKIFENLSEFYQ